MAARKITTPLTTEVVESLHAGDEVELTGVIYTGRDSAHKRMMECIDKGQPLPFPVEGSVIYYVGPSPAKPGKPIGSAGPTTSGRMDAYAPRLIELGMKGMIGKGLRAEPVTDAMKKHKAVYFAATGGAAALLAKRIVSREVIAWEDLGTEAVARLEVVDFPVIVVNDCHGGDLYAEGRKKYARSV